MFNYYRYLVLPFIILAGVLETILIGLSGWQVRKIDEYGYCYNPYDLSAHIFESFCVVCFIFQARRAHMSLADYMNNTFYDKTAYKRRLLWIVVISYSIYNVVYLATDITYALYHPNPLCIGFI